MQIFLHGNVDKSVTAAGDVQRGSGVDNGCVAQVGVAILVNPSDATAATVAAMASRLIFFIIKVFN